MSENENVKRGGISVETQHIFPIIKKWLYSDKDIFLREIVSNASDAVTKLKRLASLGQTELPEDDEDFRVNVILDKDARTVTVTDNGIGMTGGELEKYICSIALSGALDFIEKYEGGDKSGGIIGHFGLGFYSAFMVSDTVEIDTRSYDGSPAVHWTCTEEGEYEISESGRKERGTSVVMHIAENESDYLEAFKLREILNRYCSFMPVPVYFDDGEEHEKADAPENSADGGEADGDTAKPVNDTVPLWSRSQSDITEKEYNDFYHNLFIDADDPLFYIHINADYPLNFKGILYFPKIRNESQSLEGQVKLYYNQVFVADNIKEVLPDYLLMLRGALDCPELPLNVSRSYLQDNVYVKKVAAHIVKKVGDKLSSLSANERGKYEKVYSDIRIFIEYACLRERKFYDRVKDSLLLRLTDDSHMTFAEYLEAASGHHPGVVYYASDPALQAQYISMFNSEGIKVAVFDLMLDSQYLSALEQYRDDVKFVRVDAGVADALKNTAESEPVTVPEKLVALFRTISGNDKLNVTAEPLKNSEVPALLSVSEESRRFEDMMRLYSAPGETMSFPLDYTLALNTASPLYGRLTALDSGDGADDGKEQLVAAYIYRLALLAQKKLSADELSAFLTDSYRLLGLI